MYLFATILREPKRKTEKQEHCVVQDPEDIVCIQLSELGNHYYFDPII